jgi:hypothetical protein
LKARFSDRLSLLSLGPCDGAPDLNVLAAGLAPAPLVVPRIDGEDVARLA